MWTAAGLAANNPLPVLTSYSDIQMCLSLGHLAIVPRSANGGPDCFLCPLLPIH